MTEPRSKVERCEDCGVMARLGRVLRKQRWFRVCLECEQRERARNDPRQVDITDYLERQKAKEAG